MTNPYEAPHDLSGEPPVVGRRTMTGIEFESDWSPKGLRRRRKHAWNRLFDLIFASFSLLWLGSLVLSTGSPYAGIFCVLTPLWVLFSVVWFSNLSFRTGESFHKKYPGLSGRVRGRVDENYVVVHGPAVSLATRVRNCIQCNVSPTKAVLQPPGIDTSLPILGNDILRNWPTKSALETLTPDDLLDQLSTGADAVRMRGVLRGSDLRPFLIWRNWRWSGWLAIGLGLLLFGWVLYKVHLFPSWILDPPGHYRLSDDDISHMIGPGLVGFIGLGLLIVGFWQWSRTWRKLGRYSILVQADRVVIATDAMALAYHGKAAGHFHWTDGGLVAKEAGKKMVFAIPIRWIDEASAEKLRTWFSSTANPPEQSHYIGPKL